MRPSRHTPEEPVHKASGRWRFLTDHLVTPPPRALFVHVVRSPQASGRLVSWSREAALAVPGVDSVWGPPDVPATVFNTAAAPPARPLEATADQRLLIDQPRHIGDACLAVVVTDEAVGRRAEQALACVWEPGRPVLPDRLADAPRLGGARSATPSLSGRCGPGCAGKDFEVVVETENAAVEHLCLEGPACLVEPEVDGTITVHTNTQAPSDVRRIAARVSGLPLHRLRVFKHQEGGGFGAKQEVYDEPLLCFLATRLGRPLWTRRSVRTTLTAGRTRHQTQLRCRALVSAGGELAEIELQGDVNSGAYASHVAYVMANIADAGRHLYPAAEHRFDLTARFTTQIPGGAFRGYGAAQALLAVEQAVDEAARRAGLSPFEIRRRNARSHPVVGSASPRKGFSRLHDVLDRAEEGWAEQHPSPVPPGCARGWGVAACALLSTTVVPSPECTATILRLDEDGRVMLATGSCDCGTGSSHALAALVGDALAMDPGRVDVVEGDSSSVVMDLGSFAQRTVYVAGTSVLEAARALRRRILDAAASRFGCSPDELTLVAVGVVNRAGRTLIDLAELARLEALDGRTLVAVGGTGLGPSAVPLSYAVVVVAVDVHPGEGSLAVPDALIVADCGTVLDPPRVRGQLEGAFVQGLSATVCERWAADRVGRGPLTLLQHRALGAGELPVLRVVTLDAPEPTGPRGAKGVGELGLPAVAPAVANAVRDAIGRRITRIPIARAELAIGCGEP
jgi:xanthine dehydrogenase molybdenum-binding subunit